MLKRGKVLRDTNNGPGLVVIEGAQYSFALEGMWKSDVPPEKGMVVEVDVGADNTVVSLMVVPETELAKEELKKIADASKRKAQAALAVSQQFATPILQRVLKEIHPSKLVARFGLQTLLGIAALAIGWFCLDAIWFHWPLLSTSETHRVGLSVWQLVGFFDSGSEVYAGIDHQIGDFGVFSFVLFIVLLSPLVPCLWSNKRAYLLNMLPLLLMVVVFVSIDTEVTESIWRYLTGRDGVPTEGIKGILSWLKCFYGVLKLTHIGSGIYLSLPASVYFAGKGAIKFLAARAR